VRIEQFIPPEQRPKYPVCKERRAAGSFEIIVGKSVVEDAGAKCFVFVNREDAKPKRRLFEVLKAQGLQPNQQLMFSPMEETPFVTCRCT
jgi:hypothetical protein